MAEFTPTWEIPLTTQGRTPAELVRGSVFNEAMMIVDERLGGLRGSIFVEDNTQATDIQTAGVDVKAVLNSQAGPFCRFCLTDDDAITYIGPLDRVPTVIAAFDIDGPPNVTIRVSVRKNAEPVPGASMRMRIAPAASFANGALSANVPISTGDRLEIFIANLTNDSNLTVRDLTFSARG